MKKLILLFLTTLLIVSCAKNNDFEYSYEDVQRQNFEQTFIKTFGHPSSDQDWFHVRLFSSPLSWVRPIGAVRRTSKTFPS